MALNTAENREKLKSIFPGLETDTHFSIQSPETPEYNCIAWAMGFDDRWVDHSSDFDISRKKWWPDGVARDFKPETLIEAFRQLRFVECEDDCIEEGFDKVALYKISPLIDPFTGIIVADEGWTHAARIIANGVYHSKIGGLFDIYHRNGDLFKGTSYGEIYQYMKRRKEDFEITEIIKNKETSIDMPDDIFDVIAKMMFG